MSYRLTPHRGEPTALDLVMGMPRDVEAMMYASKQKLNIATVSWEDNARTKGSCWGPCISDMTLCVEGSDMPLIKNTTNFNDETWDVEIDKIPVVVGNEDDTMLRTVKLSEYLGNLRDYLSFPAKWKGDKKSLLIEGKDKHVICSAQACFLPMPKSGDATFNVSLRNYQSRASDPAVLVIVASANGTSAQVIDSSGKVLLYHNKAGQRASYVGQRLSDYRLETGSNLADGAPMTSSEAQQNILWIIQVPLKQKEVPTRNIGIFSGLPPTPPLMCSMAAPMPRCRNKRSVDVESAIISVGEASGPFNEINDCAIERDERFPIRITMQYYKATSNGAVNEKVMQDIAKELQSARKFAVAISSLVTETTDRTTEHNAGASVIILPPWWNPFWAEMKPIFGGSWSEDQASRQLFSSANNQFVSADLENVREQILDILGRGPAAKPAPAAKPKAALPTWEMGA